MVVILFNVQKLNKSFISQDFKTMKTFKHSIQSIALSLTHIYIYIYLSFDKKCNVYILNVFLTLVVRIFHVKKLNK